jgi:hypothetical protein
MGTWGTGTFDNDAASDFLDEAVQQLRQFIDEDLTKSAEDSVLERSVLAAVSCLRAILSGTVTPEQASIFVPRTVVEDWRDRYLEWFDDHAHLTGASDELLKAMRANAETEFVRFLECLA